MIVVRYVTLVSLVIWLGAMAADQSGDLLRAPLLPFVCGAVTVIGLFFIKFMGPPPIGFVMRAGVAVLMLAIAAAGPWIAPRGASSLMKTFNICLGFVLLVWYVRE